MRRAGVIAVCSALVLVGVLSAVTNPASASPKAETKLYKIYGWVIDKSTGKGVWWVRIDACEERDNGFFNYTYTNETGYYEVGVKKGSYHIFAYKADYTAEMKEIDITEDTCINFTLLPLSVVQGYVKDAKTGKGIDAKVILIKGRWDLPPLILAILYRVGILTCMGKVVGSGKSHAVEDDPFWDGQYTIRTKDERSWFLAKPGEHYTLLAMKLGYIPETKLITFTKYGEIKEVNFTLNRIIPI